MDDDVPWGRNNIVMCQHNIDFIEHRLIEIAVRLISEFHVKQNS